MTGRDFREIATAIRLSFHWLGGSLQVKGALKEQLGEFLGVEESRAVSTSKRLFSPKSERVRGLQALKHETEKYWASVTLPYLEKGVRLCKRDRYSSVKARMGELRQKIEEAEAELETARGEVLDEAREFLGAKLYNPADYPASFVGCHGFELEVVNVEPPSYLMELDPQAYQEALARVDQKFERAIELFEEQAHEGLAKLLEHLCEKMRPGEDGKKKAFHETTLTNLLDFFKRYKDLKVRDNAALDSLVEEAERKVSSFDVGGIKSSEKVRGQVLQAFEGLAKEAAKHVTSVPKRKVGRLTPSEGKPEAQEEKGEAA